MLVLGVRLEWIFVYISKWLPVVSLASFTIHSYNFFFFCRERLRSTLIAAFKHTVHYHYRHQVYLKSPWLRNVFDKRVRAGKGDVELCGSVWDWKENKLESVSVILIGKNHVLGLSESPQTSTQQNSINVSWMTEVWGNHESWRATDGSREKPVTEERERKTGDWQCDRRWGYEDLWRIWDGESV